MSKLQLITDLTKLAAAIQANQKAHQKVDATWQVLAVSAIDAFAKHGNVFYINKVYGCMGKGARHAAMTAFFIAFGGVTANTGENKSETPFIKDANKKPDLEGAEGTMWYDMAPSQKPDEIVDYYALIMKVLQKSPKEGQTTAHSDFREAVQKMASEYAATQEGAAPVMSDAEAETALEGVSTEGVPAPSKMRKAK